MTPISDCGGPFNTASAPMETAHSSTENSAESLLTANDQSSPICNVSPVDVVVATFDYNSKRKNELNLQQEIPFTLLIRMSLVGGMGCLLRPMVKCTGAGSLKTTVEVRIVKYPSRPNEEHLSSGQVPLHKLQDAVACSTSNHPPKWQLSIGR